MNKRDAIIGLIKKQKIGYTVPRHFDLTLKITDLLAEHYSLNRDEVEEHIGNHFFI